MTKAEFMRGWLLLTAQPWGRFYRGDTPESAIQVELYYKHLSGANSVRFMGICETMATGDKWPSLSEMKTALKAVGGWEQEGQGQIAHNPVYAECPEEVREKLRKLGVQV